MATRIGEHTVPWPRELVERYVADGLWTGETLDEQLRRACDADPGALALVDGPQRLTHRQLTNRADAAAARLRMLGLHRGDRIVMQLNNGWEFVVLTLACLRAGVVPVMALPAHRHSELSYLATHSEAVGIAVPDVLGGFDHQALAHGLADGGAGPWHVLVAGAGLDAKSVDLRALCAEGPERLPAADTPDPSDVAVFLLSGGTTGLPKLIARTHNDYSYNARRSAEISGLGPDSRYLACLPAGHNFTLACPGILGTLLRGGAVVMAPSPRPEAAFALIAAEGVTHTAAVPAVAGAWLEHAAEHGAGALNTLQVLQVGGARLADELARKIGPVLGTRLQQVFGMAEGLLCYTRLDDPDEVICTTQGRPMSEHDEVRLVDEQDRDVADGEPGSLLTRGPYTPRGYYRAPEQNGRAFTADGWYRSGDICRRTVEGNLVVEGRDKDMINRGGEKISAEEVEGLIHQLTSISQVAAVAMPDPRLGERVCVYVVCRPGSRLTLEEIRAAMEDHGVARFKLPERLVLVDQLPLTKVGKVDKKALRADISGRLSTEATTAARRTVSLTLPWMRDGTALLQAAVANLPDDAFGAPSRLPGWTRAHVIGHLARNAEALTRLARWAATGVENPMYTGPAQRADDIEASAKLAPVELREQLIATAAELDANLAALEDRSWDAVVRSALGREIPASEIPWMRIREVWLHSLDLEVGITAQALPSGMVEILVSEVVSALSAKAGCPDVDLHATDRKGRWSLGAGAADGLDVSGTAAAVAAWLTGRSNGSDLQAGGDLPELPPWL